MWRRCSSTPTSRARSHRWWWGLEHCSKNRPQSKIFYPLCMNLKFVLHTFFAFFLGNQTLWKLLKRKLSMMTSCNPDIKCCVCVDKNFLRLQNRVWRPIWGPDGPGGQECRRLGAQWKGLQWIVNCCGWMVVVEQECCWVGLQFTIFRWTEDLCVQLEQHESQSKKSDYQGGQLAQANTNTKQIRKACF